jgi:secreted trypsin-like serine protease
VPSVPSYIRAIGLTAIMFAPQAIFAQQVRLTGDTVVASEPYREAVRRYLQRQQPKIVGGKIAADAAYPWQASLGVAWISDPFGAHFCGGSVLNATWIVTAAHCLVGLTPERVVVTAGTNVLGVGGARINAKRLIVKSDYDRKTSDNDVALIELFNPLPMGQRIRAISLVDAKTEADLLHEDTPLIVVGWGATQSGGSSVRDLRYVEVPLASRTVCNGALAYAGRITENMICAGVTAGGVDSCQGDSGGPLSVAAGSEVRLAGIVSWGEGCARPNKYGVYTRSAKYANWVSACVAKPDDCA